MEKNKEVFSNEVNRNRTLYVIGVVLWLVLLFTTFIILNKLNIEFLGPNYQLRLSSVILVPPIISVIICSVGAFDGLLQSWYPDLEVELIKTQA
jgi:uncharacterized integral membrane protein